MYSIVLKTVTSIERSQSSKNKFWTALAANKKTVQLNRTVKKRSKKVTSLEEVEKNWKKLKKNLTAENITFEEKKSSTRL